MMDSVEESSKMKYREDKNGNKLSILGYGCMRFTRKGASIDIDKAEKEIMEAINNGVNYFDTAYVYPGSEATLGEILKRNKCREKIFIATKLPHFMVKSKKDLEKYFKEQLRRLQTDYVDYYLMHMLTDVQTWNRLKALGADDWLKEKVQNGQIRNVGFSYHGNTETFLQLLEVYDWDFCQIQYNYLDEHSQAGKRGLKAANKKGLPVIIMEPLRGGRLVNLLPEKAKNIIKENSKKRTPAEWAFRWLWNQPEVTCVLSGMNSLEMLRENIDIASNVEINEFTKEDFDLIEQIKNELNRNIKVGCTGCGYCMPCPKGVDIPGTFHSYNLMYSENKKSGRHNYLMCTAVRKNPSSASQCVECGKCENHCPQHIEIRKELKNASRELETPIYKIAKTAVKLFKLY
ncbi:aldo/keto reductase [Clostridium beijerinckii]|uniref:aldo/keto reductase n=1 Tax=Clostridium beijerinckii TaxID=1520 RepID=UPI001361C4C4|nr:aldo/keto reductase [Clostridium beijerinckii]MZK49980.1 aldo/keto reductase [Clostridium beijerinckii]MZK58222.1 aldo/keto reductase [Clostridium beijerinckii]MZK69830.1 aldo/keto reductase [Clostridium beijerinckii]MZK75208.1 aldo/keto reductase [Clostridium beijerinckii]MZK83352.1 aldo/keto reductase [Clostridium beijerinckii]